MGNIKIKNLDDLKNQGFIIAEDDEPVIENKIMEVLNKKGITVADLARISGISRQNINGVTKNKIKPGVDFALKISHILNVPVDELFVLKENAWTTYYKKGNDVSQYVDIVNMEIIDSKDRRDKINSDGFEYVNVLTGEKISSNEREKRLKEYIQSHKQGLISEYKNKYKKEYTSGQINTLVTDNLRTEFNEQYTQIYKRIQVRVNYYQL